jgi:hypothetical protein
MLGYYWACRGNLGWPPARMFVCAQQRRLLRSVTMVAGLVGGFSCPPTLPKGVGCHFWGVGVVLFAGLAAGLLAGVSSQFIQCGE